MSIHDLEPVDTDTELLEQFHKVTAPYEKSIQAGASGATHNDGEAVHKRLGVDDHLPDDEHPGIQPFHKYLAECERKGKSIARYPTAGVAPFLHVTERELDVLRHIDTTWAPDEPKPTHDVLRNLDAGRIRGKLLEWVAADDGDRLPANAPADTTVDALVDGGTDLQIYGEPGSGKTTIALSVALWLMQLNNETVIWADSLDDSGTNERAEWLIMSGWTTLALPSGLEVDARLAPEHPSLSDIPVALEEVARDVIRYDSPLDLVEQLEPGQFYVVFPDPLLSRCEAVSQWRYWPPADATPRGEQGPDQPTPADHFWFAFYAARITYDKFLHPTTVILDEAGNLLDPDARKDIHDTYQKCKWFKEKFADARKKHLSFITMTHALSGLFNGYRQKQRWWFTPGGTKPPIGADLPGNKECPIPSDYVSGWSPGAGQIWHCNQGYASIGWPNLNGLYRLDAELSIEFPEIGGGHS